MPLNLLPTHTLSCTHTRCDTALSLSTPTRKSFQPAASTIRGLNCRPLRARHASPSFVPIGASVDKRAAQKMPASLHVYLDVLAPALATITPSFRLCCDLHFFFGRCAFQFREYLSRVSLSDVRACIKSQLCVLRLTSHADHSCHRVAARLSTFDMHRCYIPHFCFCLFSTRTRNLKLVLTTAHESSLCIGA